MKKVKIILISVFTILFVGYLVYKNYIVQSVGINEVGVGNQICSTTSYAADAPITVPGLTYPAIVQNNPNSFSLYVGGLTKDLPTYLRSDPARQRFPASQEEIWVANSSDLNSWSQFSPSLTILPETPVVFKNNSSYKDIFPNGFKLGCAGLPSSQCNVQINDPSTVHFNNATYLYFSILENYRWYDGSKGGLVGGNPNNPSEQNRHSIGLAVSGDNGKNWAFVGKVIVEDAKDDQGNIILGAWAPSAVVNGDKVELFFHDALGTKQYVAFLKGGASLEKIRRINNKDTTYRTNLDVVKDGNRYIAMYNDANFSIVEQVFTSLDNFGVVCPSKTIVPASTGVLWPTPHQIIANGKVHLFFWKLGEINTVHHWSRVK